LAARYRLSKYGEVSRPLTAGSAYHGRASDTWAVGVTLYCMVSGHYPFLGDTLQETYDKVRRNVPFLLLELLCVKLTRVVTPK
jgi:serine/threonine protein kinase